MNDRTSKTAGMIKKVIGSRGIAAAIMIISMTVSLLVPAACGAEVIEDDSGFYLGLKLIGSSLHVDEDDEKFIEDDGGGMMFDFGWRFNPVFALEISLGGAVHETVIDDVEVNFGTAQILAYYRFLPDRAFRPFVKGGFGYYALFMEEGGVKYQIEGGGIAIGGGFKYFITEHFAMGLDLTHNIINYDTETLEFDDISYEAEIDEDGSQTSMGLTVSYSF